MRSIRARSLRLVAAAALIALTAGCTAQSPEEPTEAPGSSETPQARAETPTEPALDVPDPRTLTGLTAVQPIEGIEPVTDTAEMSLPATVTGDDGVEVTVESRERIVTLDIYGTISQTIIGLGLADNVVGRTVTDTDPAVADAPLVTSGAHSVNVEAVMEVRPTLVLLDTTLGPASTQDVLRQAGVDVVVLDSDRRADLIADQIRMIAAAVGAPDTGEQLVERVSSELDEARSYIGQLTADVGTPLRMAVLYVRGTAGIFFLFGGESAATGLISDLAGDHVASGLGMSETVPANAESLITIDPEVLLLMEDGLESTGGVEGLATRPGLAQTTAGMNERIVTAPDAQLISFGPNYPKALTALADAVYLGK